MPYRPDRRSASIAPSEIEQSPPSTTGNPPEDRTAATREASARVYDAMAAELRTPSPGDHVPTLRPGVTTPPSAAPRRSRMPRSRSTPGVLLLPGTAPSAGGRR